MAIIVDKNGLPYLISDNIIEEPPASGQIFDNIKSLAVSLNSLTNITRTNLGTVQSTIQSANSTFNVFAVASHQRNSESLQGVSNSSGIVNFTQENFVYNTSSGNRLSTGKTIVDMSGGINSSLPEIDGKKWMGMAVYDGNTNGFKGIMLWIFTNELITSTGGVITGTASITNTSSIFFPGLFTSTNNFRRIYQVVIGNNGSISASNVTGNGGWLFSTSQAPLSTGYNLTSRFSSDDGIWAFVLGGKVNGEAPGPSYKASNGYGFGNFNSSDASSSLYWAGSSIPTTNYVGFLFTGDA
jgi:hypothetical protein